LHELAIAEGLVETALAALKDTPQRSRVVSIEIEAGEMSTVVPEALEFSFAMLAEKTRLAGAKLVIRTANLRFACRGCRREFGAGNAKCPGCGGTDVETVAGRQVRLMSIEVED